MNTKEKDLILTGENSLNFSEEKDLGKTVILCDFEDLNGNLIEFTSKLKGIDKDKKVILSCQASIPVGKLIRWDMMTNIKGNLSFLFYNFPNLEVHIFSNKLSDTEVTFLINYLKESLSCQKIQKGQQ